MKKLIVCGKEYEAGRIVKDGNEIRLYTDGKLELTFPNISNLDDFELEEGQEWDVEINEVEVLKQD